MSTSTSPAPVGREQWRSQSGFILAAVGSAIGLGNIWRFPGVAYTNGGGAFLIPYVVALLTAGVVYLLFDWAMGHRYHGSAPAVFRRINKWFEPVGWLQVGISFAIVTYYAVIVAWAVSFIVFSVDTAWGEDPATFFVGEYLQAVPSSEAHVTSDVVGNVFWPLLGIWVFVAIVMALGVSSGLERMSKVFLPLLAVLFLALVIRALTLPGAAEGLNSFFTPDWGALADPQVWISAYAQIFFSLSVMFGIMLTYASYLPKRANLTPTGFVVAFSNSSFELLAGIGVFATLGFMAVGQGVGVSELEGITGPVLSFITFPQIISQMPGGPLFGVLFFASLTLAGITSLVSLLQVISAAVQEKFGLDRKLASVVIAILAGAISTFLFASTNGLNMLDVVDNYVNNIGVVSSAVLTVVLVVYVSKLLPVLEAHLNHHSTAKLGAWWRVFAAYVTPIVLFAMLVLTAVDLVTNGYLDYPAWYANLFGWGTLGVILVLAFVMTALPWRTPVDLFSPRALGGRSASERAATRKEDGR